MPGFASAEHACERFVPRSTTPSGGFSPSRVAEMQKEAIAMADCLRRHGVPNFPDPKFGPHPGGNFVLSFSVSTCHLNEASPAFRAAVKACPSGLGGNFMIAFIRAQQTAGAACA